MLLTPSRELVLKKLRDCFPSEEAAIGAMSVLDLYGGQAWHRERDRVHLAVLMQCRGELNRLRELVALADRDYRDALVGAEYPEEFQASSKTSSDEMAAIRRRDRAQYEAWLHAYTGPV
jgi:hypothetical protein